MLSHSNTKQGLRYEPGKIESSRQAAWKEERAFRAPSLGPGQVGIYVKPSSPFTSGDLHMGHVRSYTIADAYARFCRAKGRKVLLGVGLDAFGLPAELGAIQQGVTPAEWVAQSGEKMLRQLRRLGFSFDYERVFYTCEPNIYRWSQWLFLVLFERELIYRATTSVDWCDSCQSTLPVHQVARGRCWRCGNEVCQQKRPAWYIRASKYLFENSRRLEELKGWNRLAISSQVDAIGRVDGVEVDLKRSDGERLTVFTPHCESLSQASFVLVSPRWPDLGSLLKPAARAEIGAWQKYRADHDHGDPVSVALLDTGVSAHSPDGRRLLPILVSPHVDSRFGPTAYLAIPTIEESDRTIESRLPRKAVAATAEGCAATPVPASRFRAFDFPISRPRCWGTPIPIVDCPECGQVPVPFAELPLELPSKLVPTEHGNALETRREFVEADCPNCGGAAKRHTDTLDSHFDALWMWLPPCVPIDDRGPEMFTHESVRRWLPVSQFIAGSDSGMFMLNHRMFAKMMRDAGPFDFLEDGEPFARCLMHQMVTLDGRKMSKHSGAAVGPDNLVSKYGADAVRMGVLYASKPTKRLDWNEESVRLSHRFLIEVWSYASLHLSNAVNPPRAENATRLTAAMREKLATWCETGTIRITGDFEAMEMHRAVRNLQLFFKRIVAFEEKVEQQAGSLDGLDAKAHRDALRRFLGLLAPIAPHFAEALMLLAEHPEPLVGKAQE